jgi:hypothetical protein
MQEEEAEKGTILFTEVMQYNGLILLFQSILLFYGICVIVTVFFTFTAMTVVTESHSRRVE